MGQDGRQIVQHGGGWSRASPDPRGLWTPAAGSSMLRPVRPLSNYENTCPCGTPSSIRLRRLVHLRALTARQRTIVFTAVEEHLSHQPEVETRNRKPMRSNPVAPWELRIGELRVYYNVESAPDP